MSILDLYGLTDDFADTSIYITKKSGKSLFVDGVLVKGVTERINRLVTLQGASPDEINFVTGGERISDVRRFYLNDGTDVSAERGDMVDIDGKEFKVMYVDNRPSKNYCKVLIERLDPRK